jgi:hypothetical protein
MIQIKKPWPWKSVNHLLGLKQIKDAIQEELASLFQMNSLYMGFNMFSFKNGMRITRW